MEKKEEQQQTETSGEEKKGVDLEGLPVKDSPYVKYKDLEDYKQQGYGTQGHLQPKPGHGAGATDAPTPSGAAVSSKADVSATDVINRHGAP
ncbi:hypothetical protein ACOSQ3_023703 [Xanthoceras sorbifolium]